MRKSMINENIDFVKTRINKPESVDEAKEKVALVEAEQQDAQSCQRCNVCNCRTCS